MACTAVNGDCAVNSDEDCKRSGLCASVGRCDSKSGKCVASSDEHCRSSDTCKESHLCIFKGAECVDPAYTVDRECVNQCSSEGRCTLRGGKCVAVAPRQCARTRATEPRSNSACARFARCTLVDGGCVTGWDEDCRRSPLCTRDGQWNIDQKAKASGRAVVCMATSEVDSKASSACRDAGRCALNRDEGVCVRPSLETPAPVVSRNDCAAKWVGPGVVRQPPDMPGSDISRTPLKSGSCANRQIDVSERRGDNVRTRTWSCMQEDLASAAPTRCADIAAESWRDVERVGPRGDLVSQRDRQDQVDGGGRRFAVRCRWEQHASPV